MKYTIILSLAISLFLIQNIKAQEQFIVEIEPLAIIGSPNIHSFSWGKTSDGKWIIVGGRIDGLHRRQPFAAFLESSNNKDVFVIDPISGDVWNASLQNLPVSIYEQLQSTNQEFHQRDNSLYVIGGYGYSPTQDDHITYPNLTAIALDGLANAVINGANITPFFRQVFVPNLAVTGGQLDQINDIFYLCGGQYFEGRYNPMGPGGGPGFIQEYTDEIIKFEINDDGTNLSVDNYIAINDPDNLHRRDYNMVPQIFPNGERGATIFSGVFQPDIDLPWLNSVDVTTSGYTVNNNFNQYLSQYHSAKVPIYDSANNVMHSLFFGGMSQYTLDINGNLIQDDNVPFVKTISKITRSDDGTMTENKLDIEMPTLLGSGAEFIPITDNSIYIGNEIVALNSLPQERTLIGYIFGGIESTQENIFFINNGTQSSASNQIFKVFITKSVLNTEEIVLNGDTIYNINVFPNPSKDVFSIELFVPNQQTHLLEVSDMLGRKVEVFEINKPIGRHSIEINLSNISSGEYILSIRNGTYISKKKIIKH